MEATAKQILRVYMINCCSSCAHANDEAKLKTGSLFDDNKGNLRERNWVSSKITMLIVDIGL